MFSASPVAKVVSYGLCCYTVPTMLWCLISINGRWKMHEETNRSPVPEERRLRTWECFPFISILTWINIKTWRSIRNPQNWQDRNRRGQEIENDFELFWTYLLPLHISKRVSQWLLLFNNKRNKTHQRATEVQNCGEAWTSALGKNVIKKWEKRKKCIQYFAW